MRGPKRFTRNIEDFTCDHCGQFVVGDGYTNHCNSCLWSKHVDVNPGDRQSVCMGAMQPTCVETVRQNTVITHTCVVCGYEKRNRSATNDSIDAILLVIAKQNAKRDK